jgi:hypothetical protein
MKDLYTIFVTFTFPAKKINSKFYQMSVATYFCNDDESLPMQTNLLERFKYSHFNHYTLVVVEQKAGITKDLSPHLRIQGISLEEFLEPSLTIKYFLDNFKQNTNLVFMFRTNNWQNILTAFRLIGISISGGPTSKRHINSPVSFRLDEFLKSWFGVDLMRRIVDSYYSEEKGLRSRVKPYIDFTSKTVSDEIKMVAGDPKNWLNVPPFDELFTLSENTEEKIDSTWSNYVYEIPENNSDLRTTLNDSVGVAIVAFIQNISHEVPDSSDVLMHIRVLTNKIDIISLAGVKRFHITELEYLLNSYYEIFNIKRKEIVNEGEYTTHVVIRYKIVPIKEINSKLSNDSTNNTSKVDKREYHTISNLNILNVKLSDRTPASVYNTNINNFTPFINKNRNIHRSSNNYFANSSLSTSSNDMFTSKETNNYLDSVKEILNNPNYTSYQAQEIIETTWIDIVIEKLKDLKYLTNRYSQMLTKNIKEANTTLNIYFESGELLNKFPFLIYNKKESIKYLLLTFAIIIAQHHKLKYTALSVEIGKAILFHIYTLSKKNKCIDKKPRILISLKI